MAALNLSGFKKLKEDKKTVTMGHPKGHSITILKSKISALQREQLEKLPAHMADGGDVEDDSEAPPPPTPSPPSSQAPGVVEMPLPSVPDISIPSPPQPINGVDVAPPPPTPSPQAMASQEDNSNKGESSPATSSRNAPVVSSLDNPVDLNKSYQQGQKAISEQQNVAAELAKRNADIQQQDIDARKALQTDFAQTTKDFQQHQQQFMTDFMNNHVNPNHYIESMSSGQKAATAIGLLIGGFTGGFTHGNNPAADWLNGQINRDIEAQRSRLDQQKTILGANQELYRDNVLANNATRINMNDIYDHKIQLAANQVGTAQAKANADAAHSKFAMENNALLQQNALRATALKAIRQGGAGLDPLTLQQAGLMSPEDAKKEQASFDAQKAGVARVNALYEQANKEQTAGNLLNPQSYERRNAINSGIRDAILATDINHRLSPEVLKTMLDPNLINTRDTDTTRALKQNDVLQKLQAHAAGDTPILSRYAPQALPRYSIVNQDQRAIEWAQNPKNKGTPQAAKILEKNGISTDRSVAR